MKRWSKPTTQGSVKVPSDGRYILGDLVLVVENDTMIDGVDRHCPVVIDVEDKITALSQEVNRENIISIVLKTLNSLIGETSNCATTYHNKVTNNPEQKKKYEEYIDMLSVINGKNIDKCIVS